MAEELKWQDEYNIGVDVIDNEHRRLFKIINKLLSLKEEEKDAAWTCREGIKYFEGHAQKHFHDEEQYMEDIDFEGRELHKRLHDNFRSKTLPVLHAELKEHDYQPEAVDHFLGVCAGWLVGHTLTEDQALGGKPTRKWNNMFMGEEIEALQRVIIEHVFDLFQLESRAISDNYHGERFGHGVYYRMIFGRPQDDKRLQVLMAWEEDLLIHTVGSALGMETNRLTTRLTHASRFTARQFVISVMEHFPKMADYELISDQLLTYEQFHEIMDRERLQASLLLDSGKGYFAFSVIAPHLIEGKEGEVAAKPEADQLGKVEEYLEKREQTIDKPRILVVDDSAVQRANMELLLKDDYEVALADSGIAAIRAITLNRPDLVLLDYAMPVCDGRQTLEMMRSHDDFRDIRVVFLTGKSDPESVKKVMSLKPAGYLLKHMKSQDIKDKIDKFMEKVR